MGENLTRSKKPKRSKPSEKVPSGRPDNRCNSDVMNQATSDEFEREGMGIAPKE